MQDPFDLDPFLDLFHVFHLHRTFAVANLQYIVLELRQGKPL